MNKNFNYKYKCSSCYSIFEADKIESEMIYICPLCGNVRQNEPLKGVLEIFYDYDFLKNKYTKNYFDEITSGKIWLYPDLWPIDFQLYEKSLLNLLSLPQNQILHFQTKKYNLFFQDETRNPTYSFKDRATIAVVLKAIELGITEIAAASTGNAGSSLAGICARMGIKSHIFVPKNIPEAKRIQIQSYGANIYIVDGDYDEAFDLCLNIASKNKWYNRNTAFNPLTLEGKKSAAYDIFINTKGEIPDVIFIPVGDGVIISGIFKGFSELLKLGLISKLPKLIAVQAEGSSAIVDYLFDGYFSYKPAHTIADSISAGAPRNLFMAVNAVKDSLGFGIKVSDDEIISSQRELSQKFGILVEPSCSASFAGYKKAITNFAKQEKIMLLMTGSGLKDFNSLKLWNEMPSIKSADEWKNILETK